ARSGRAARRAASCGAAAARAAACRVRRCRCGSWRSRLSEQTKWGRIAGFPLRGLTPGSSSGPREARQRVLAGARHREQQQPARDAEVLVEVEHVRVALRAFQLPIAMPQEGGPQREQAEEQCERAGERSEDECDTEEE